MSQSAASKTHAQEEAQTDSKSLSSDSAPAPTNLATDAKETVTQVTDTSGPTAEERKYGSERIEALYAVFGGKNGASIWLLYLSLALFFYAYSLAGNTVSNYLAFATSAFGSHTVLSTISTMVYIIAAVGECYIYITKFLSTRILALIRLLFLSIFALFTEEW